MFRQLRPTNHRRDPYANHHHTKPPAIPSAQEESHEFPYKILHLDKRGLKPRASFPIPIPVPTHPLPPFLLFPLSQTHAHQSIGPSCPKRPSERIHPAHASLSLHPFSVSPHPVSSSPRLLACSYNVTSASAPPHSLPSTYITPPKPNHQGLHMIVMKPDRWTFKPYLTPPADQQNKWGHW